jgi:hypothetical protein
MNFTFLKPKFILSVVLILIIAIVLLIQMQTQKQSSSDNSKPKIIIEHKPMKSKPKTIEPKSKTTRTIVIDTKPKFDAKPISETEQILIEQKKLDAFEQKEHSTKKTKENVKVDYSVGLEDGATDTLKNDPTLKPEMLNGKIGVSKSF